MEGVCNNTTSCNGGLPCVHKSTGAAVGSGTELNGTYLCKLDLDGDCSAPNSKSCKPTLLTC